MMEIGKRVGVILGIDPVNKVIHMIGYGAYAGIEVPPPDINPPLNGGRPNPKLILDSGEVAWGCEVWWGPEDAVKAKVEKRVSEGFIVNETTMAAARAAAAQECDA